MIYDADASRSVDKKSNALLLTTLIFLISVLFQRMTSYDIISIWLSKSQTWLEMANKTGQRRSMWICPNKDWTESRLFFEHSLYASPRAGCFTYTSFYSLNLPDIVNLASQACHWASKRVSPLIPPLSHPHRMIHTYFPLKWFPKGGTFPKNSWPLASPHRGGGVTYLLTGLEDMTSLCGSVPPFLFLPRAHVVCWADHNLTGRPPHGGTRAVPSCLEWAVKSNSGVHY